MKNKILLLLLVINASVNAQIKEIDSSNFDFKQPKVGDYVTYRPVWGCTWGLRPDVTNTLDNFIMSIINSYPFFIFQIENHTDCRGSYDYNKELTQRRSDSLRTYILSKGIDSSQIIAKGMGEDSLLIKKCNCDLYDTKNICTELEHQLNRRTILRIIGRKEE